MKRRGSKLPLPPLRQQEKDPFLKRQCALFPVSSLPTAASASRSPLQLRKSSKSVSGIMAGIPIRSFSGGAVPAGQSSRLNGRRYNNGGEPLMTTTRSWYSSEELAEIRSAVSLHPDETITRTVRIDRELLGRDAAAALNADLKLDDGTIASIAVDIDTMYTFMRDVASRFRGVSPLVLDPDVSQKIVFDSQYKNAAVGDPRRHGLIIMPFMPRGEKSASVNKPNRTCPLLMVADVRMGGTADQSL